MYQEQIADVMFPKFHNGSSVCKIGRQNLGQKMGAEPTYGRIAECRKSIHII